MTTCDLIEASSDKLIATLRKLIAFETINPPGADYDAITRHLMMELSARGLSVKRLSPPKKLQRQVIPECDKYPRYNVLGLWRVPGAKKTLHFNAHYDVVPVSGDWEQGGPFSGAVSKGWLHGRGSADMKGSIAALLIAFDALRACGQKPLMNIEVSFTADEETDSILGTDWLVNHAPISPDYALVMEGGKEDLVCCGHNGVVWLEVEVIGKAAHGSRPDLGVNALEKMSRLVLALEDYRKRIGRSYFVGPNGSAIQPTMNIGGVFEQGPGGKINTVPALARFTIDRRVIPGETVATAERGLRKALKDCAAKIPGCRIRIRKISENHPCYCPPTSPFFGAVARSITNVRREKTEFAVSSGFTDMHFFSHVLKVPTLGYGPGGTNEHGVNEKVRLAELVRTARIYAKLMTSFAG